MIKWLRTQLKNLYKSPSSKLVSIDNKMMCKQTTFTANVDIYVCMQIRAQPIKLRTSTRFRVLARSTKACLASCKATKAYVRCGRALVYQPDIRFGIRTDAERPSLASFPDRLPPRYCAEEGDGLGTRLTRSLPQEDRVVRIC